MSPPFSATLLEAPTTFQAQFLMAKSEGTVDYAVDPSPLGQMSRRAHNDAGQLGQSLADIKPPAPWGLFDAVQMPQARLFNCCGR